MMDENGLGKVYEDGEIIIRQGEAGDRMYVIQEGRVAVVLAHNGRESVIAIRGPGEFFGEMALFEREERMATVRSLGGARILSVDQKNLMRRLHEDPSLGYRIIQTMSQRIRVLSGEVAQLRERLLDFAISADIEPEDR